MDLDSYDARVISPEHYAADRAWLRQVIERERWQHPNLAPGWNSVCPVKHEGYRDDSERYTAWLHESVLTGLETSDPLIAVRAYGQACDYLGRTRNVGHGPRLHDALMSLRNRLEAMLSAAKPVLAPILSAGKASQ